MPDYKPWSFAEKHAYRQKQASRFTQNARAGDDQKSLSGWMVSDTPETTKVYGLNKARQVDSGFNAPQTPTARPVQQKGSGGGGFLGGLAKVTSGARSVVADLGGAAADAARFRNPLDELGGAGKTVLEGFDKPRKYVGAPALGIATGALGGRVDEQGQRHGGYGFKEWGRGIVAGLKDPMAAGQAVEDISRTYPLVGRAAAATASDPLSFVGPGLASKAVKAAGMGGRAGAVAAGLLDSGGGGVALGGHVGSEADIEYGAKIPGWNKLSPEARQLIAGVAGGMGGGIGLNAGKQALKGEGPLRGMGGSIVDTSSDHATLGLDPTQDYSPLEVRRAWRKRMGEYHPDVNAAPDATVDSQAINAAFERSRNGLRGSGEEPGVARDTGEEPINQATGSNSNPPPESGETEPKFQSEEPAAPGPPPPPDDGYAAYGSQAPRPQAPLEDLIDGKAWDDLVGKESAFLSSKGGRVEQGARKVLARLGFGKIAPNLIRDPRFTPVWQEMNRITNQRQSMKALVESMWRTAERSGLKLEQQPDGNWFVAGTNQHLGDVVEHATPEAKAVWEAFSPETKTALTDMTTLMDQARQTVQKHGGDMPMIDVEGAYFPRKVAGIGGQEKNAGPIGGRRMGARQGFQKERSQASMAGADDVTYAHPLDAFEAGFDAKLRVAQDSYVTNLLKPLADPNARAGFGGFQEVPGVGVLNEADAARATAGLTPHTPGTIEKVMGGVNRALTPIRASYDASGLFQQGMRRWLSDPVGAARDWRTTLRSLKDPETYHAAVKEYDEAGPGLKYLARRGLRITAEGEANEVTRLTGAATPGTTRAAGKLKGAATTGQRISSELYDRPLNLHRLASANGMYKRLQAKGLAGEALDAEMDAGMKAVNRMYGWTGTRPSSIESAALFAPRYFRANIETIVRAATDMGIEGAEARKHLAVLAGEGAALVLLMNKARGYETEFDPRSSNFMRIRNVGGLDVSPFGGFDILMRAIAGTIGGDAEGGIDPDIARLGRLAWGKASPALKLIIEPLKGETYMGHPLDPLGDPKGFAWEQFKSSVPFGAQNLIEGVQAGEPGDALTSTLVGSLGVSQQPVTPSEKRNFARDEVAQARFGKPYDALLGAEKSKVNQDSKVAGFQKDADRNTLTKEDDRSTFTEATVGARTKIEALSGELEAGQIDGETFRDQYKMIQAELRGARNVLKVDGKKDKVLDGWFELYEVAAMADGRLDWEMLDQLQAEYEKAFPDVQEKLLKAVGVRDNQTLRDYREAKNVADAYYELPAYQGMSTEESRRAGTALARAQDLVSFGRANSIKEALLDPSIDPKDGDLAMMALAFGSNPERKLFRQDPRNKLFAKFYGPGV